MSSSTTWSVARSRSSRPRIHAVKSRLELLTLPSTRGTPAPLADHPAELVEHREQPVEVVGRSLPSHVDLGSLRPRAGRPGRRGGAPVEGSARARRARCASCWGSPDSRCGAAARRDRVELERSARRLGAIVDAQQRPRLLLAVPKLLDLQGKDVAEGGRGCHPGLLVDRPRGVGSFLLEPVLLDPGEEVSGQERQHQIAAVARRKARVQSGHVLDEQLAQRRRGLRT